MADAAVYSPVNTTPPAFPGPANATGHPNATGRPNAMVFSPFEGCELMAEGILFDLAVQCINLIMGIPANMLVIAILLRNRKDPSTSDIFLGCLAFLDIYFGAMVPLSFLNLYLWRSKSVWSALKFAYGIKDTSGPLFLSCICLDRFVAVLFPLAFGRLKNPRYRVGLSVLVLGLTFAYAAAKTVGGLHDFEKVFTGEILAVFAWMTVCNVAILLALKRSRGAGKDEMHPMKKKAFKMVLAILALTVCNYLPLVAMFPFEDHYAPDVFRCYVQPVGFAFLNISSSTQPLIFLSRLDKLPFLPDGCLERCSTRGPKAEESSASTPPASA
ncbi:hypothetical protein CRUP_000761 [Coryphaenoides rupestris]|nr:hypothetical protein CRUP_000761 [Coryphaenoides rupestris]